MMIDYSLRECPFCGKPAEDYIKERIIENVSSDMLDFNKPGTLTIENDSYIEPLEVTIVEETACGAKMDGGMEEND